MRALQILVIAVLMRWVLARTFTLFQWEALLLLVAGITVNQLNYCKCAPRRGLPAWQRPTQAALLSSGFVLQWHGPQAVH